MTTFESTDVVPAMNTSTTQQTTPSPDLVVTLLDKVESGSTAVIIVAGVLLWLVRGQLSKVVDSYVATNQKLANALDHFKDKATRDEMFHTRVTQSLEKIEAQTTFLVSQHDDNED